MTRIEKLIVAGLFSAIVAVASASGASNIHHPPVTNTPVPTATHAPTP